MLVYMMCVCVCRLTLCWYTCCMRLQADCAGVHDVCVCMCVCLQADFVLVYMMCVCLQADCVLVYVIYVCVYLQADFVLEYMMCVFAG